MDAVTQNVFTKDDRLLVVAGGAVVILGIALYSKIAGEEQTEQPAQNVMETPNEEVAGGETRGK